VLLPPDPSKIEPAKVFHATLSRVPVWPIDPRIGCIDEPLFVRAVGSREWIALHRAIGEKSGRDRTDAEFALLASVVVDGNSCPAFAPSSVLRSLYEHEVDGLAEAVSDALAIISPTYAVCDVEKWISYLKEGAKRPENWCDMLSLSGCCSISFGFGKGMVHARHDPETFFGVPRRDLLDCHWIAYHAARAAYADLTKS
jgi:hypothetical protein